MSSLALTAMSVPLVVLPNVRTSCNVSVCENLVSTYNLTAALVGIVVLLLKFSSPLVEVTN